MKRRIQLRSDFHAIGRRLAGRQRRGVHNSRELDLALNGSVLVEIPIETVLIIPDSGDEGNRQSPRPSYFRLAGAPIRVLPKNAEVFFMQAHRILQGRDVTEAVHQGKVEVMDYAETVAAQRE